MYEPLIYSWASPRNLRANDARTMHTDRFVLTTHATAGLKDIVFTIFLLSNPNPPGAMHLRQRRHDFVLPNIKYDFNKRCFIARSLFTMSKFYVFVLCLRVCIV